MREDASPSVEPQHPPVDMEAEVELINLTIRCKLTGQAADSSDNISNGDNDHIDTASITSSVIDYQYENGRRYHGYRQGQYLLPNDDDEQNRLDLTHHICLLVLGGELCMTKLPRPRRILDVGTGTGIWAIDMGDLYPEAEIYGIDLSPIQPKDVPPNVQFFIQDANDDWNFPDNYFDFIHVRELAGGITHWPTFLRRCHKHLAQKGKLEIVEGRANFWYRGDSVPETSYTHQWIKEWRRLGPKVHFDKFPTLPPLVQDLPFTEIRRAAKVVPLGTWPKDNRLKNIGRCFQMSMLDFGLQSYTLALFTRAGKWKEPEVQVLLSQVRNEIKSGKMHLYTFL